MAVMLGAMRNDAAKVERIGVNLANALTPGYQREILVGASPAASGSRFAGLVTRYGAAVADDGGAPVLQVLRDSRPGTLKATGQAWDVALASRGYFEVNSPEGPALTRRGQFQLDVRGRLVTPQGWPVMGLDGDISPGSAPVVIDTAGRLQSGGRFVAQLKIVEPSDPARMRLIDAGYFTADTQARQVPESQLVVRQGHLENANVNSSQEMVDLMRTMRHFESMSRMLQGYDDMMGGAIRKLGES